VHYIFAYCTVFNERINDDDDDEHASEVTTLWRYTNLFIIIINVVVKMDFSNAFNSLHRVDMLQAVADRLPAL